MKKITIVLWFVCSVLLFAQNPTINVQGVLRDADGNAVTDGEKLMIFKFYNSGGTQVGSWSESQSVVVINGIYNVQLGSQTPLTSLQFNETYFLEIEVDSEVMEPRIPLSLTPYSLSVRGMDNVFPSTGNVGIGTGTGDPLAPLHVEGNTFLNGNVGVGMLTPVSTMHVTNPTGNTRLTLERSADTQESFLQYRTGSTNEYLIGMNDDENVLEIYSYMGSSNIMSFDGVTGNVGINTYSPDKLLDINLPYGNIYAHSEGAKSVFEAINTGSGISSNGAIIRATTYKGTLGFINSYDSNTASNRYSHLVNTTGYDLLFKISPTSGSTPVTSLRLYADNASVDLNDWRYTDDDGENCYVKIGNITIQWGKFSLSTDSAFEVTLPVAFANDDYSLTVNRKKAGASSPIMAYDFTTTSFKVDRDDGIAGTNTLNWIAIGKR